MASKKDLKKDIHFLVEEVIGTYVLHQEMQDGKGKTTEDLDKEILEMLEFREEMLDRVNQAAANKGDQTIKQYYRSLYQEMMEKVNGMFEKLGEKTS